MYKLLNLILVFAFVQSVCAQKKLTISSPDKKAIVNITVDKKISYSVQFKNDVIVDQAVLSMIVDGTNIADNAVFENSSVKNVDETITPLYGKFSTLKDQYHQLDINFDKPFSVQFRVYNEGVAYRFITNYKNDIIVDSEIVQLHLKGDYTSLFPETPKITSWELPYASCNTIDSIHNGKHAILPALFTHKNDSVRVVVAEADVRDYPGMFIQKNANDFTGYWAHYPKQTTPYGGEWGMSTSVDTHENFIAKTSGKRNFPWRIIMLFDDDKKMLTNQLIYTLAAPQAITDVSWIKPGKADWEWWHDAINEDAGFPTGMDNRNTQLYKYYIDFAAAHHLEYTLIDAGWSNFKHVDTPSKKVDIQYLADYGNQKNVGLIVWCNATSLLSNLKGSLDAFQKWGLKGIKVDFFDRDDQQIIHQQEEIAREASERHLLVDFHGSSKPTGLQRTYPNVVNYEAVRGEECSKWDYTSNPEYHLQVAFIRMLCGPMDYTPGSMRNMSKDKFIPVPKGLPATQGTRCHELSMFVLYDQYLGVLCDAPSAYDKDSVVMHFLSAVPVTYDDTKVLDAKLGEYAVLAKQKGNDWYVGAMNNWTSRDIKIDFSFLPKGIYAAEIFRDGDDADTNATSYMHEIKNVNAASTINMHLAQGGGAVIQIVKQ